MRFKREKLHTQNLLCFEVERRSTFFIPAVGWILNVEYIYIHSFVVFSRSLGTWSSRPWMAATW